MNEEKAIVLIGPPGSGKTSAGRLAAARLGWSFADTDILIEQRSGMSVAQIFSELGEKHFRQLETDLLVELCDQPPTHAILATGGGIVVSPGNFALLARIGRPIALMATPETLAARLSCDQSRPLLADAESSEALVAKLVKLMSARKEAYECASFCINTTDLTTEEVVDTILATRSCPI